MRGLFTVSIVLPLFLAFAGCRPSYLSRVDAYRIHADATPVEKYARLENWAAHPAKHDPSDSVPRPLRNRPADTLADVFFVHPTTFTNPQYQGVVWNAELTDPEINAKTDYTSILYQASVFNAVARVFAPRYRQAHIYAFYTSDSAAARAAFDTAYADIKEAFLYYLQHENRGRPFIIAAHSQGMLHAARLIKELIQGRPLQQQLVVAYLLGLPLPEGYFTTLGPCSNAAATGCYVSWRTFRAGYLPAYVKREKLPAVVVNPLSWTTDTLPVNRTAHEGAVLFNFNKVYPRTNGAQIRRGVLWIDKPRFPFSFLSTRKNYHAGDINLFYINIRNNLQQRVLAWQQQQKGVE
ncbi:MAG: DUF3089 domain-containing protein [Lacibacter sp.]